MATNSRTIMSEIGILQSESANMQQRMEEMAMSTRKINQMGNTLSEISNLMEDSITKMGNQVDQFEV